MMASYFEKKLLELLPAIYRESDNAGDLEEYLRIPASELDEIKELIDTFPTIVHVDACDERYLHLLGQIVGSHFDPLKSAGTQRREIRETIEKYRRKASLPAICRSFTSIGWQGQIYETFRTALRLNRRAKISKAKLPGLIHSLGVFRIKSDNLVQDLRPTLSFHHPAGTKAYFWQWLYSLNQSASEIESVSKINARRICPAYLDESFPLNTSALNTDFHLTRKVKNRSRLFVTKNSVVLSSLEGVFDIVNRWRARRPGFLLNHKKLNHADLTDANLTELNFSFELSVDTTGIVKSAVFRMRLNQFKINQSALGHSKSDITWHLRQRDNYAASTSDVQMAVNQFSVYKWPAA